MGHSVGTIRIVVRWAAAMSTIIIIIHTLTGGFYAIWIFYFNIDNFASHICNTGRGVPSYSRGHDLYGQHQALDGMQLYHR